LKASQQFTLAWASLDDPHTAAAEIDRVITACITHARPVYIMLPTDIVFAPISSAPLSTPLPNLPAANDPKVEEFVVQEIVRMVKDAGEDVVILADACAIRHHVENELWELLKETNYPVYSAPMGKTIVPEDYERYGGVSTALLPFLFHPRLMFEL
jgi:pyruvate decarboxylase